MKQIMAMYGKFLLEGTVLVLLMTMIFIRIEDDAGNKGIFEIVGARLEIESTPHDSYSDFSGTFQTESRKSPPKIRYSGEYLRAGINQLSDSIKVFDYAGRELTIKVTGIQSPSGEDMLGAYNADTTEIDLNEPGIYIVTVSALDDGNRCSKCQIRIPVNK